MGTVEANRKKLTALFTQAAKHGAKIIVLPETAITGHLAQDLKTNWHLKGWPIEKGYASKVPATFAEPVPGPSTRHFAELAKQLGVYVTVPLLEVAHDGKTKQPRYFNTVCLASPEGKIVAHYRKLTPLACP